MTQRKPVPFTHYDRLFMSCGTIIISIIGAFITYLLFEAPFASLVKELIIQKKVAKTASKKDNIEEETNKINTNPVTIITVLEVPGKLSNCKQEIL